MEYLTEMVGCLRATGGNLAIALGCIFLFSLVASAPNDGLSVRLIACLLFFVAAWRVVVWMFDVSACSF